MGKDQIGWDRLAAAAWRQEAFVFDRGHEKFHSAVYVVYMLARKREVSFLSFIAADGAIAVGMHDAQK